jgi:hypothetical protein
LDLDQKGFGAPDERASTTLVPDAWAATRIDDKCFEATAAVDSALERAAGAGKMRIFLLFGREAAEDAPHRGFATGSLNVSTCKSTLSRASTLEWAFFKPRGNEEAKKNMTAKRRS